MTCPADASVNLRRGLVATAGLVLRTICGCRSSAQSGDITKSAELSTRSDYAERIATMGRKERLLTARPCLSLVVRAAAVLALAAISACSANPNSKTATKKLSDASSPTAETVSSSGQSGTGPGIDLQCVMDRIQNPADSFHYSYKKETSEQVHLEEEAEVTPQTIDGSFTNASGKHPVHGVHSDAQSWQGAWSGLIGIAGMSSAIALVNHNSAMKRESDGSQVNGYDSIHYSIDTGRFDATERQILGPTMGPGGFEKGDVWVTAQGCPVKLILDDEMHNKDGSLLEKVHYEEAMVKK